MKLATLVTNRQSCFPANKIISLNPTFQRVKHTDILQIGVKYENKSEINSFMRKRKVK